MAGRAFDVFVHRVLTGYLLEHETGVSFRLAEAYRSMPERPVLSQSFEDDLEKVYVGKRGGLPTFFENLVPEGALRDLLQEITGLEPSDDLGVLEAAGRDLPGAVEIRPTDAGVVAVGEPPEASVGTEETTGDAVEGLRFSLAGMQLKFSMIRHEDKLTMPATDEFGEWIVKLDSERFPNLVDNEYATLEWARATGLDVPECHLHNVDDLRGVARQHAVGASVLALRRYDRKGGERVHQEDLAQALGRRPEQRYEHIKYEQLAYFIRTLCGDDAYEEFVRRLAFVVASGNADAHLKNWSLVYPDRMQAQLAPLYDQVATVAWSESNPQLRRLALKLGGAKEFARLDLAAIRRLAERAGEDPARTVRVVRDLLGSAISAWKNVGSKLPMPPSHLEALRAHWHRTPLLRDYSCPF